ncbi:hypothetical protein HK405_013963 [Cladochytrium tenue]|nr:hypothetical protein HK405_013963 [Cladochytrium tenue]
MMSDWAERKLAEISFGYLKLNCPQGSCYGWHGILSGFMYDVSSSRDWRAGVQNGYWAIKFLAWAGFVVMAFFIPNGFFVWWSRFINVPGAVVFILVQIVLLIDFAYTASETLLEWWESSEDKKYLALLLTLTFGAFVAAIVLTGFLYAWFGGGQCQLNVFFISFNIVLCAVATFLSFAPAVQDLNPKSGIAQAAMVVVYATYLVASALTSEPQAEDDGSGDGNSVTGCNPMSASDSTKNVALIMGSILTFLALAYTASAAAVQGHSMVGDDPSSVPLTLRDSDDDDENAGPVDDEKDGVQYNYSFFHFIFLAASCYVATLITNVSSLPRSLSLSLFISSHL